MQLQGQIMFTILTGSQFGDEGKVVDLLAENYDIVVRFQGRTTPATQSSWGIGPTSSTSPPAASYPGRGSSSDLASS